MDAHKEKPTKSPNNPLGEYYSELNEDQKRIFKATVILKLGVDQATLYRWMRGKNRPRKTEAIILAEICGIPANKLYPHHFLLDNIKNQ